MIVSLTGNESVGFCFSYSFPVFIDKKTFVTSEVYGNKILKEMGVQTPGFPLEKPVCRSGSNS